jgi:hypothetical protein
MAKLLGGLASVLALLALLAKMHEIPPHDLHLHLHDMYNVLVARNVLFIAALNIGVLAVLYFAICRRILRPTNHIVDLVGFTLIVVSLPILFWENFLAPKDSPPDLLAIFGANSCFLSGLLVLTVNLAWAWGRTIFREARSRHLSSH